MACSLVIGMFHPLHCYPYQCLSVNTGPVIPTAATRWCVLEKPNLYQSWQVPPLAVVVRFAGRMPRWQLTRTWGDTAVFKSQLLSVTARGAAPEDTPQLWLLSCSLWYPELPEEPVLHDVFLYITCLWCRAAHFSPSSLAWAGSRDESKCSSSFCFYYLLQLRFLNCALVENLLWFCSWHTVPDVASFASIYHVCTSSCCSWGKLGLLLQWNHVILGL